MRDPIAVVCVTHWNKKLHVSSDFELDIGYGWLPSNKVNKNPFGERDDGDDAICMYFRMSKIMNEVVVYQNQNY